jgi:choline dehydrogenase
MDAEKLTTEQKMVLETQPGLTIAPCQLRPESRGHVRIRSADPAAHPAITPNYLSDPLDQEVTVAGLRWGRRIAEQPALSRYIDHETKPGPEVQSDTELLGYARDYGTTIYHPVGTCAMGRGPYAVVDPQLRVHGIDRLRVVDASIMPRLISGNTNAPTIMIAEKAADMIRGKAPLTAAAQSAMIAA